MAFACKCAYKKLLDNLFARNFGQVVVYDELGIVIFIVIITLSTNCLLNTCLSTLQELIHLDLTPTLADRYYCYPHDTAQDTGTEIMQYPQGHTASGWRGRDS